MAYKKSLFLDDFKVDDVTNEMLKKQLNKIKSNKTVKTKSSIQKLPLDERLKYITAEVLKILGRYKGFIRIIRDENEFREYIDKAISIDLLSFDTETDNSLDPLTCKLMGLCMYMPNTKPVYVPINHTQPGTDILLENQISMQCIKKELGKLKEKNVKMIYHNAKFDVRVCHGTCGLYLPIWWDTMIGSQLLDENEQAKLKYQYRTHVDPTIETYNIESLFTGLPYAWIDPEIFGLYAAIDAYDTYLLQQYQQKIFEQRGMEKLYKLFTDVEIPVIQVVCEMEDNGISMDLDFVNRINTKFEKLKDNAREKLEQFIKPYQSEIEKLQYQKVLDTPINFDSNEQLGCILYDVMKTEVKPEFGKSTDKDTLKAIDSDFTNTILEYRHYSKLISSFTKPLPQMISPKDGKIHASFNQMGKEENSVRTGRFSSTDPNMQQMPSKEKTMRLMFKASEGNVICGSDFAAQEPRCLTYMCNEPELRKTFDEDKDPYATLCAPTFHLDYWDCMEHTQSGEPNPDGKKMRSKGKVLMLGVMYGMGAKLMAKSMNLPIDECKVVLKNFYEKFSKIKEFVDNNEKTVKEIGYVEDYMGRRRRLPNAMLPELEIKAKKKIYTDCDIFADCSIEDNELSVVDIDRTKEWSKKWEEYPKNDFNAKNKFKKLAKDNDIDVFDNGAYISKCMTQCTNARIQGSAASLTKKAMVAIHNDKEMNELGFKLLIPVHDELLGECPKENAEKVSKRLSELMINAAKPEIDIKFKCDPYIAKHWYADEVENEIRNSYNQMLKGNINKNIQPMTREEALNVLYDKYSELSRDVLVQMCDGTYDVYSDVL